MSFGNTFDARREGERVYSLTPGLQQIGELVPGQPYVVHTMDSSGDQITEDTPFEEIDRAKMFPVVGPLHIQGVRAGDAVGVEVRQLTVAPVALTWTRPGLGFGRDIPYHVRSLPTDQMVVDWGSTSDPFRVPSIPHVGTVGLLPSYEEQPRSLGDHGGNIDSKSLAVGATIWLRAQVDGGGLFLGDVHAGMGDAEVCGTGAETAAEIEIVVHHRTDWSPSLPTIVRKDSHVSVIGVGDSFDSALAVGLDHCVDSLVQECGYSEPDAYLAAGMLLNVQICQVVNPRTSVEVSLAGGADRHLLRRPR